MNKEIIFIAFFIIQYIWDRLTSKCNTLHGEYLLIFHHIISTYIYLGGIVYNPFYHLIFIFIVILHWITNNNRCELTVITNRNCGYPENRLFHDIIYKMGISIKCPNIMYIYILYLMVYDIYIINN